MTIVANERERVRATASPPYPSWRQALKDAVRDPAELCRLLDLPPSWAADAQQAAEAFGLCVPRPYLSRIQRGDPSDPLLRQVLPRGEERAHVEGFTVDPVGDRAASLAPALLQKYPGRVLLIATQACGMNCRYCFRRHFSMPAEPPPDRFDEALAYIATDESIDEVILSGGDPLVLPDDRLAALANRLAAIGHVRRLRVHTRMPIVIPQRVTNELLAWLRGTSLAPVVVVHVNHPAELDEAVCESLQRLIDAGIPVLNQAVLLAGVNDDTDVLAELCHRLVDCRVMPYYLHQLDRVAGAAHFEVSPARGLELMRQLKTRLPGYAVPRYVREAPGELSKVEIVDDFFRYNV